MNMASFRTVIGLEVHVQLKTRTKLFCRCSTRFGAPPNTQVCPVCTGMPGALPKLNRRALELAVLAGMALHCEIPRFTKWDRKNYFYPDLPKGYQISQYDLPVSQNGYLEIGDDQGRFASKRVGIIRAHLEEDAGKSMHDEAAGVAESRIDLNRTGTPLLEIVSRPDMASAREAKAYLTELKLLLEYLGVSDCNMQEGSLRVDANVNLHIDTDSGTIATPIVEVKNMNSFRAVERALEFEARRQYDQWRQTGERLGDVPKQTRGWDDQREVTVPQREKEESSDYRYFPDPDLVPVVWSDAELAAIRQRLGASPREVRSRLIQEAGLSAYDAGVLVQQGPAMIAYWDAVIAEGVSPKRAANWLQQDILRLLKERSESIDEFPVSAEQLAELLRQVESGKLNTTRGREVLTVMVEEGRDLVSSMESLGIREVDASELETLCRELLQKNPSVVEDVRAGKVKAIGALIGQARKLNPNADPGAVRNLLMEMVNRS